MELEQLKTVLEQLNFSSGLPEAAVRHFAETSSLKQFAAGEVAFREGSVNRYLHLIREGRLALEMTVPGRSAVRILTLGVGDMAGWSALLGEGKMTATAVAVESTDVILADAHGLQRLTDSHPEFGYHLMRRMAASLAQRLVATRLQLLDLFADAPAPSRPGP